MVYIKQLKIEKMSTVRLITSDSILFNDGYKLSSYHQQDCCEAHYLNFEDLTILDFDRLEFDLSKNDFFKRIQGYGIELVPIQGHTVKIAGYASNSGYYSSNLDLVLTDVNGKERIFDISECQDY